MQTSIVVSQKTSSGLDNFYVDDWEKGKIRVSTLYLVFRYFQRSDQGPARLRKQS